MNKRELIEDLSTHLGDKETAARAVDSFVELVQAAVARGEKVQIVGFGSFERQEREARTARNPATGETIHVPATAVPKFKPASKFKERVADSVR